MPRPLRVLITGSAFFIFFFGGAVLSWLVIPVVFLLSLLVRTPEGRLRMRMNFMRGCFRFFVGYMTVGGLLRLRRDPLPDDFPREGQGFIIIANHPSLLDVVHMMALFPGLSSMAGYHYYHSFAIGPLLRATGHVCGPPPGRKGQTAGATDVLDSMVTHLRGGKSLLVFPEGTRSPLRGLRRFRRGAIEAAIRAEVPIVPVFISQDPASLMKGQRWYEVPYRRMQYRVEFFPIVQTAGRELDARALHRELYDRYKERCAEMLRQRDHNARVHGDPPLLDRSARPTDKVLGPIPGQGPEPTEPTKPRASPRSGAAESRPG